MLKRYSYLLALTVYVWRNKSQRSRHACLLFFCLFFYKPGLARLKPLLCVSVCHQLCHYSSASHPPNVVPFYGAEHRGGHSRFQAVCLITVDIIGQKLRFSPLLLCSTPLIPNMVLGKALTGLKGGGAFLGTGKPPQQSCAVLGKRPIGFFFFGTSWTLRSLILNAKI